MNVTLLCSGRISTKLPENKLYSSIQLFTNATQSIQLVSGLSSTTCNFDLDSFKQQQQSEITLSSYTLETRRNTAPRVPALNY